MIRIAFRVYRIALVFTQYAALVSAKASAGAGREQKDLTPSEILFRNIRHVMEL